MLNARIWNWLAHTTIITVSIVTQGKTPEGFVVEGRVNGKSVSHCSIALFHHRIYTCTHVLMGIVLSGVLPPTTFIAITDMV